MKKKTYVMIIGLSLIIMLFAIDTPAKSASSARSSSSSVRSSSGFRGAAKASVRGGASARGGYYRGGYGGFQGGRNYYHSGFSRGYYHGYYGWGSYWPYWSIGSYFTYLPDDYTTVYVDGTPYYYCDGSYFTPYSSGYMVVPTPTQDQEATEQASSDEQPIVAQPKSVSRDTTTINIPNSKGGYTPVRLVKHKNGYIGPQGEFYTGHPTVAALKALYGD